MNPYTGTPFRVLYVCTGNVCRSPFAELLTRHLLGADPDFTVGSAGVAAVVGQGVHPATRRELEPWGVAGALTDSVTARQLTPELARDADLVLGLTTAHRSAILRMAPHAIATTFALREFARLAAEVDVSALPIEPVERSRALVAAVRARRGVTAHPSEGSDDVPDPIGRSQVVHHEVAVLIAGAVRTLLGALAPSTATELTP